LNLDSVHFIGNAPWLVDEFENTAGRWIFDSKVY